MKREFLQELKVGDQPLPKEVIDAIMEENGKDVESAKAWQEKYNQAQTAHQQELAQMAFNSALEQAIGQAKGRNTKAITALLDVETLKNSEDPQAAIEQALQSLKQDCGYLFEQPQTPPPYARGTGSQMGKQTDAPTSLAGALRERFEKTV